MAKVGIVIGSKNDIRKIKDCINTLKELDLEFEIKILSAHRTPQDLSEFATDAKKNGFDVIIAAAGMSAHLAGAIASKTIIPVIAIPLDVKLGGIDSLLSTVNMPPLIPVACVGIDSSKNAAILAAQIIALKDEKLYYKLIKMRENIRQEIIKINEKLNKDLDNLLND